MPQGHTPAALPRRTIALGLVVVCAAILAICAAVPLPASHARLAAAALAVVGAALAAALLLDGWRNALRDPAFALVGLAAVAGIVVLAHADGGANSPLVALFYPLVAFTVMPFARWAVLVVAAADIGAYLAITSDSASDAWSVAVRLVSVLALAMVCYALARATQREAATLSRAAAAARHRALHDELTGLPNRALFMELLDGALARQRRAPDAGSVAVLYVDLDGFKQVNDDHGHAAGDTLLRAVGPRLRLALRASDGVARLGGDEFVCVCERVSPGEAGRLARRVAAAVAQPTTGVPGQPVAASVGVAEWDGRTPASADELVAQADAAMYAAKRDGQPG